MKRGEIWTRVFAELVLRLAYFGVTALIISFAIARHGIDESGVKPGAVWLVLLLSLLVACIGPRLYREERDRGRGSLRWVRGQSGQKPGRDDGGDLG